MSKITSITEKVPQAATLPDGIYHGKWSGHEIELDYSGKTYILATDEGVRGSNISVAVKVTEGVATFECFTNYLELR